MWLKSSKVLIYVLLFISSTKKIAISHGFNMNSNSWKNPRWRPLLVTSQANQQRHYP